MAIGGGATIYVNIKETSSHVMTHCQAWSFAALTIGGPVWTEELRCSNVLKREEVQLLVKETISETSFIGHVASGTSGRNHIFYV